MKTTLLRASAILLLSGLVAPAWPQDVGGLWTLTIEDLQHKVITSATIRLVADRATSSCMGGDWKRVIVSSFKTADPAFFPVSEPLSYSIDGARLTIGRNEICDQYRHLEGSLHKGIVRGEYVSFGLGGGTRLGYFSARRQPSR
jgi:hypothetical protein